jgi:uncharacterized membrane protein
MSTIDIAAQIEISAEPTDVAGVMFDPHRDPEWMKAVKTVNVVDAGIKPGARVERTGSFMGREFSWTTEVVSFHFPHLLELRISEGPIVGTVTYNVVRSATGSTAKIRNVGDPGKFGFLPEAMITTPMRSALTADLERLKTLVERSSQESS